MLLRRACLLAAVALAAAGCGSTGQAAPPAVGTLGGVGVLPGVATAATATGPSTSAGSASSTSSTSTSFDLPSTTVPADGPVGSRTAGNRLLLIGDSVLASTSQRYSNDMCNALVPLGWRVEVDAEVGRFIDFGARVLDRRLAAGWDATVVFLGSNYGGDQGEYAQGLSAMVDRVSPMPVVLVTVSEFEANRREVNDVIRLVAAGHDNVVVLDWAVTTATTTGLLGADHLHLAPLGRAALAENVAAAFGPAPTQPGECLTTAFRDDSAGTVVTGTTSPKRPVTTQPRRATPTTVRPVTPTTTKPPTGPPVTQPPVTQPPVTQPPITQPPATQPPVSQPPGP